MTDKQRTWIVLGLSLAVAATRLPALSLSMWDWDEALFCAGLRDFDVGQAHPHAPGFPLYIALGRLIRSFVSDDFLALRSVQLLASFFLFPSFYALARALRFPFALAISAALLFVFLPNVWFYGGTAFSDILAIVLFLAGAAWLFAAREGGRARYLLGTIFFSLSLLVRPQNVLLAYPWIVATWPRLRARRFREVAAAVAISVLIVGIGYGAAAFLSGPGVWLRTVGAHSNYLAHADGFLNPDRPSWWRLFPRFAIDPFDGGLAPRILFGLALAAFLRPKQRDWDALATFAPFLLFALFMLSETGTSRLSIGFIAMNVLLATDGMAFLANLFRTPKLTPIATALGLLILAGSFALWTLPALREVRSTTAPPVEAMNWIRANVPRGTPIYIGGAMAPFVDYHLTGYPWTVVVDDPNIVSSRGGWYVSDGLTSEPSAIIFRRPREKLWALFTRRYFEVYVQPVHGVRQR
jgi:hypothetical protein